DRGTHEGLGGLLDPRCESKAGFTSWRNVRCRPEVHHLIDYESKTWNEPLLRELVRADDERTGFRCQVDASWVHEGQKSGMGFILMDGEKKILVGMKNCPNLTSPLQAEAEGLSWAMKKMLEEGHVSVHFETDCAQLIKLIQSLEEWPAMAETIEDILIISRGFVHFSFSYLPRARAGSDCFSITFVETPVWLAHVARLLE
ncbi:hypothetical protein IGI04_029264, partial [Brassica rapa subsp. trilocularis]